MTSTEKKENPLPIHTIPPGRLCPCGARTSRKHGLCRKCQARLRWLRRATAKKRTAEQEDKVMTQLATMAPGPRLP